MNHKEKPHDIFFADETQFLSGSSQAPSGQAIHNRVQSSHVQASQVQVGPNQAPSVQAGTSNVQSVQPACRLYELPPVPIFNTNVSTDLPQAQQINHFSISLNSQPPTPHSLAPPPSAPAKVPYFTQPMQVKTQQQIQPPHSSVLNSKPTLPDASKASKKSLFSTSELALMRVSSKIDNLADALQNNNQENNNRFHSRNSSPNVIRRENSLPPRANHFQQHLFNQIFKNRLIRAFTETAIYSHPFEHFVIHAPEEVHRISSKIETYFKYNTKNQFLD
jgi:hypothetical protein